MEGKSFVLMFVLAQIFFGESVGENLTSLKKCCQPEEWMEKIDSSYKCVKTVSKRIQFVKFETHSNDLSCVENYENHIAQFTAKNGLFEKEKTLDNNLFPKCCPLGFAYNSKLRSCQEQTSKTEDFSIQTYVKVGLPECLVIVDDKVPIEKANLEEFNHNLKEKENYCVDKNLNEESYIVRRCQNDLKVCENKRCIRKCCQDGQSLIDGTTCADTFIHGLDLQSPSLKNKTENPEDSDFAIIHGQPGAYTYIVEDTDNVFVDTKGVYNEFNTQLHKYEKYSVKENIYCLEHLHWEEGSFDTFKIIRSYIPVPLTSKKTDDIPPPPNHHKRLHAK